MVRILPASGPGRDRVRDWAVYPCPYGTQVPSRVIVGDKGIVDYNELWTITIISSGKLSIGAFAVTSHAVSRGCLAAQVGRRCLRGALCMCFVLIHSVFAPIVLIYNIMIMFCIGAGYIGHCVDGSFYFFIIQKIGKRIKRTLVESGQL